MRQPSITDYVRTLENPRGVFRTMDEIGVERDVYGDVELRAGNSAAVFTYTAPDGQRRFLKCYVRPNRHLRTIYRYIEQNRPPLVPDVRLLRDELYVHTLSGDEGWLDIVEGRWTEGETLDLVVSHACRNKDPERLDRLALAFDGLCRELLAQEWAHGDLKPENIVVRTDGTMALIDCDAMWVPSLAGQFATELGTPAYRHPRRGAEQFDKRIDDYPMLLISVSLHALAHDPSLFARYNTTDNIIFSPERLVEGDCAAFGEVSELFARNGMAREAGMLEACCSRFPETDDAAWFFRVQPPCVGSRLFAVCDRGKWGFGDEGGDIVIPPFWDEALDFRRDVAAVRLDRWWHLIDRAGIVLSRGLGDDELRDFVRGS